MEKRKIGLTLAGGGGRGAYQIGVWKALHETGLDQYITSVSGTSVGGLNSALFIQNDLGRAQRVWESISMHKILTSKLESDQGFKRLSFFERDGLKNIIDDNLDMRCFDNSKFNCWMTCLRRDEHDVSQVEYEERCTLPDGTKGVRKYVDGRREYFNMKFHNDEQRKQILLATSAMPFIFPEEEVDGHKLGDGGTRIFGGDNVPVKPLYEVDKCDLILIVHLHNMDKLVDRKEFPNATLFELFPKENLGSIFAFTAEEAKSKIRQGYEDTYALFHRISESISLDQNILDHLANEYEKEHQYSVIMKNLEYESIELMNVIKRFEERGATDMETFNGIIIEDEDMHFDTAAIISRMLESYSNDDLIELLCECETLLETNDTHFRKLNEHGFKRLYYLIIGIEKNCRYQILNNFQRLHTITLAVQKNILWRFNDLTLLVNSLKEKSEKEFIFTQQCINFLLQKVVDHGRVLREFDTDKELMKWERFEVKNYISEANTKKILQVTSDIYSITRGNCIYDACYLEAAIETLELSGVEIAPDDFANEILQDSACLPLYIKDELNYNDTHNSISDYGTIIYQIYKLVIDPNIQDLSTARNESLDTLCLPLLKRSIAKNSINSKSAIEICKQLLDDLKHMHSNYELECMRKQELVKQHEDDERKEEERKRKELEDQKRYKLAVLSPSSLIECDSGSYTESLLHPTDKYSIGEEDMKTVKEQINSFSPAVVIKPYNSFDEKELVMENKRIHIASLSDFYFCLWHETRKQNRTLDENARHVIMIDYYAHCLHSSCYSLDSAEGTPRLKHSNEDIWYTRLANNIIKDIYSRLFSKDMSESDFYSGITTGEIVLYRTFAEVYMSKKLDGVNVHYVGEFAGTLKKIDVRRTTIDLLYNFKEYTKESGNE